MTTLQFYRYLFLCRPDPRWFPLFRQIAATVGQPIRGDPWHLTLCTVAETTERDHFLLPRIRPALHGQRLHSFSVNLSRVSAGSHGACARTFGRQDDVQDFYRILERVLRICGIEPLHRKSGLHPHVTLGYRACVPMRLKIALEWFPAELLLVESEVGLTRHNVLGRWSLLPPRQPLLPLGGIVPRSDGGLASDLTSPAWRSAA